MDYAGFARRFRRLCYHCRYRYRLLGFVGSVTMSIVIVVEVCLYLVPTPFRFGYSTLKMLTLKSRRLSEDSLGTFSHLTAPPQPVIEDQSFI